MKRLLTIAAVAGGLACPAATQALADAACTTPIKVLAQPRDGLTLLEQSKDEFTKLSGTTYTIDYLNENDRRAKSKADASTVGTYNVYYIDEANVALFAKSKWVVPLLDYYPKEYDANDFNPGAKQVGTIDGVLYFAPITGGDDLFLYRTDLLEKAGIQPPKTLDELVAAAKKLNDPAHNVYGIALRGGRGSGANVWRWMPYFRGLGGQWFDGDKPAFDSAAAVKATETYLELFKYSPPGTQTGSWDEDTGAFLAGNAAMMVESSPIGAMSRDPKISSVVGKVGFAAPPKPLTGGAYGHGFAIGVKANPDDQAKKCAGLWIAWATSKENEKRRVDADQFTEINRTSTMESEAFKKKMGPELAKGLAEAAPVAAVNFWQNANWPALGDRWGIMLEEMVAGTRTDIKGSLGELEAYAKELVSDN